MTSKPSAVPIVATDGGQGYDNESDARDMADKVVGGSFKEAKKMISKPKSNK